MDQYGDDFDPQGGFVHQPLVPDLQYDQGGWGAFMEDLGPIIHQQQMPANQHLPQPNWPPAQPQLQPQFVAPEPPIVPQPPAPQPQPVQLRPVRRMVEKFGPLPEGQWKTRRAVQYGCPVCPFVNSRNVAVQDHIGRAHNAGRTYKCPSADCEEFWASNRQSLHSHARRKHGQTVEWRNNIPVGLKPIRHLPPVDDNNSD